MSIFSWIKSAVKSICSWFSKPKAIANPIASKKAPIITIKPHVLEKPQDYPEPLMSNIILPPTMTGAKYPQEVADLYQSPLYKDFIRRTERKIWSDRKAWEEVNPSLVLKLRC